MNSIFLTFIVCIAFFNAFTSAYSGVDVSARTYASSFSCLSSSGYHFACVRVYKSSGSVDSNGPLTMADAWSGGMKYVDGYVFPCYSCGNPAKQIDDTVSYLSSHGILHKPRDALGSENLNSTVGVSYGMLWIDVEGPQSSVSYHLISFFDLISQFYYHFFYFIVLV